MIDIEKANTKTTSSVVDSKRFDCLSNDVKSFENDIEKACMSSLSMNQVWIADTDKSNHSKNITRVCLFRSC